MFATLRRNKTWLWGIIIVVVIIAFVIFFTPDINMREGMPTGQTAAYMDGKPVPMERYSKAYREAYISYFLSNGQAPKEGTWDGAQQAKQRLFLLDRAEKQRVAVSDEGVALWIKDLVFFKDQSGKFVPETYDRILKEVFEPNGISKRDLEELGRSEVAIQQLLASYGLPGALTAPRQLNAALKHNHEIIRAEIATFENSNYLADVKYGETNLLTFYTNRMSSYRIPDKMQVHYVAFNSADYLEAGKAKLEKIENWKDKIDQTYLRNGAGAYKDDAGNQLSEEAAKEKILKDTQEYYALLAAREAVANQLIAPLFNAEKLTKKDFLDKASELKLTVSLSAPFAISETPEDMDVTADFTRAVFARPAENAIMTPVLGKTNVYAVCIGPKTAGYVPAYTNVAEKVKEDYLNSQASTACRTAARKFSQSVTNKLAEGKTFEEEAVAAGATFNAIPDFTLDTVSSVTNAGVTSVQLKNSVSGLAMGKVSSVLPSANASYIVYLKERVPAEEQTIKDAFAEYAKSQMYNNMDLAFREWFMQEYATAEVRTVDEIQKEAEEAQKRQAEEAAKAMETVTNTAPATTPATNASPVVTVATNSTTSTTNTSK